MKSAIESIKTINNINNTNNINNSNNTNNSIKNDKLKFTNTLKLKARNLQFDDSTNVESTNSNLESLEYSNKLISLEDFSYSQEFSDLVNNINNCDHIRDAIYNLNQLLTFARLRNDYKLFENICKKFNDFPIFNKTIKSRNMGEVEEFYLNEDFDESDDMYVKKEEFIPTFEDYKKVSNKEYIEQTKNVVIAEDTKTKELFIDKDTHVSESTDIPLECMLFIYKGFDIKNILYYVEEVQTYSFVGMVKCIIDFPDDNSILADSVIHMFKMYSKIENNMYDSLNYLYDLVKDSEKYYIVKSLKFCMDLIKDKKLYIEKPEYIKDYNPVWKSRGYINKMIALKYTFEDNVIEIPIPTEKMNEENYDEPEYQYNIFEVAENIMKTKYGKSLLDVLLRNKVLNLPTKDMSIFSKENKEIISSRLEASCKEFIISTFYNNFTDNKDLNQWYGPSNPLLFGMNIFDTQHKECMKYGGCRMFLCNHDNKNENLQIKPGKYSWFKGTCDMCLNKIQKYHHAVRRPLITGGWSGCYCSFDCVHKFYISLFHYENTDTENYETYAIGIDYFENKILSDGIQDR